MAKKQKMTEQEMKDALWTAFKETNYDNDDISCHPAWDKVLNAWLSNSLTVTVPAFKVAACDLPKMITEVTNSCLTEDTIDSALAALKAAK